VLTLQVPEEYGEAAGRQLFLYYHADNDAWVISHAVDSLDVLAYAPAHIKATWHVNNGRGPYIPDPTVKLVTGVWQPLTIPSA